MGSPDYLIALIRACRQLDRLAKFFADPALAPDPDCWRRAEDEARARSSSPPSR